MTPELTALTLAGLLQMGQYGAYIVAGQKQAGRRAALGNRDEDVVLTGRAGRIQRALNNHFEGLIMFTLAVVVIALSAQSTWFTATCAWVYLIARIAYVYCYVGGLTPWRSYVWFTGLLATLLMLLAALI